MTAPGFGVACLTLQVRHLTNTKIVEHNFECVWSAGKTGIPRGWCWWATVLCSSKIPNPKILIAG